VKLKTKKIKSYTSKLLDYLIEGEYNIFRVQQLAKFGVVFTSGALFFILMNQLMTTGQWRWYWKLICAYFLPPAGKETILPLGLQLEMPQFLWCFSIWYFDLLVGLSVLTNWWLVEIALRHSKLFRQAYDKLQKRISRIHHKKYGKLLPSLLLIFMLIPFQGSGAITTAILGSSLGFGRREIFFIIALGSLISIVVITATYLGILKIM